MFCPPDSAAIQSLTEKTKLLASKCSAAAAMEPPSASQATFKSYISDESCNNLSAAADEAKTSINCLAANLNLSTLNRYLKDRCSFVSTNASYSCNTLPKRSKPKKKSTVKWYIKVSL